MAGYWSRISTSRIGRRRAILTSGGAALGAAFLAACGSDDGGGSSGTPKKTLPESIYQRGDDSSKSAKRGGTWKSFLVRDPQNFDLYNFDPFSQPFANSVGSKLVKVKPGYQDNPPLAVEPDVASSWELSPDKLTLTFKLNPNAKWSPMNTPYYQGAPGVSTIANRVIDSEDVLFAWERWGKTASASGADELVNSRVPSAPVTSITAPDKSTVVMKLNKPFAPILIGLGNGSVSYFYILPKEGRDGSIDFFKHQYGGGPFMINTYEPSVRMTLKRNPNYELRDTEFKRPYVENVELPIIPDASSQLAQFRTGSVFTPFAGGVPLTAPGRPLEEVLKLKQDIPELNMMAFAGVDSTQMWFGMRQDSPWKDLRVRQAMSYAWDRDLYVQTIFGTDKLEAAGIPANIQWNAAFPAGELGIGAFKGWYLDPKDAKNFGENAKYFGSGDRTKDVTEAKALLAAAGHRDGLTFKHVTYPISPAQQRPMDVIEGIISDAGFKVSGQERVTIPQIFSDYINNGGEFKDLLNTLDFGGPDPAAYYRTHYHKAGSLFGGWPTGGNGNASKDGDSYLNDNIEKLLGEFDEKKRISLSNDIIRHLAKMNYKSRYPGAATQLTLAWPAINNLDTWRGYGLAGAFSYEWIDDTKAPLKRA